MKSMNPYQFFDCGPIDDKKHFDKGSISLPDGELFHLFIANDNHWYRHYSSGVRHPATDEEVVMWKLLCVSGVLK